jgi:hypothetical protein
MWFYGYVESKDLAVRGPDTATTVVKLTIPAFRCHKDARI